MYPQNTPPQVDFFAKAPPAGHFYLQAPPRSQVAKHKKNSEKGFELPYNAQREVFARKLVKEFDTWRTIKLTCGPSFSKVPEGLTKRQLDKLVKIGWLKHNQGKWWQVPTEAIFPRIEGTKRHWHPASLLKCDPRSVLYRMEMDYLFQVQRKAEASPSRRGKSRGGHERTARHVKDSVHNLGLAHSLPMATCHISIGYSYKCRKLCEADGLAFFAQRKLKTKWKTIHEARLAGCRDYLWDTGDGIFVQASSSYHPVFHNPMRYRKRGIGGKKDQREISNFVTGGAYAM